MFRRPGLSESEWRRWTVTSAINLCETCFAETLNAINVQICLQNALITITRLFFSIIRAIKRVCVCVFLYCILTSFFVFTLYRAVVSARRASLHPPRLLYVALYTRKLHFWVNKVKCEVKEKKAWQIKTEQLSSKLNCFWIVTVQFSVLLQVKEVTKKQQLHSYIQTALLKHHFKKIWEHYNTMR